MKRVRKTRRRERAREVKKVEVMEKRRSRASIFFFYLQYRFLVCEWNGCVLLDAFLGLSVSYW